MPLVQLPVFISFFIALRKMATLPIESMQTGGLLWFNDLTAYDPYYVLPVVVSLSMLATIEVCEFYRSIELCTFCFVSIIYQII